MHSKTTPNLDFKKILYRAIQSDISLFKFVQDHAPDGLWLWDLANRDNIWLNDRFGAFLGYEKGEISDPSEAWQQLVHVHDHAKITSSSLAHFQESDDPFVETVRLFHKTGRWIWMQCHCLLLRDDLGRGEFLLGGVKDLTQERADSAASQTDEIEGPYVIKVDMRGRYIYANDLFHERFEIEKSAFVGEPALSHIIPEDQDRCLQLVEKCLAQPNVMHRDVLRKPFKGGTYIAIEWDFCLLTDTDGNPQEILCLGYDIDERKKMRKALEKQEQLYKSIVSALSEGMVVQDHTDKIVMCNESASRILGLTRDQLLGKDSYDPRWKALKEDGSPFNPEDHPSMITLRTGQPADNVIMNVHTGDTKRSIISINSRPILDQQGKLLGAVATFTDITEQKRYEQALKENKARFKAFAAHIPGQVFIKYPSGKHVFGNQRTLDHLGMDLQTYRNSTLFDLFERDYVEYIHSFDEQVHKEKRTIIREFPLTTRGKEEWFQEYKFPINEELIGGFMLDITERKKAENQLMLTNLELSRTSGLLNEAQRLAKMGNFVADLQRETMQASDNLYAMLAIPGQEEYPLAEFLSMIEPHPEDAARIVKHYYQCVAERSNFEAEFRCRRGNGEEVYLYTRGRLFFGPDGHPQQMIGILQDITERRKAGIIRKTAEMLEVKNKEMEQFAYVASHDLQEPLRTVMSFVSLFVRKYKDQLDEDGAEYLRFISDASSRMSELIKGLLAYSRIGINRVKAEIDCRSLIASIQEDLAATMQQTGAVISLGELPVIEAYKLELRQLFQNLISNALKFRREDAVPHITVNAWQKGEEWIFSVQDNGIGIAQRHQEQIFNIFQRLHPIDVYQGTGIGLANCRKIVELHQGRIWVESEPDQGSTFYFSLKV